MYHSGYKPRDTRVPMKGATGSCRDRNPELVTDDHGLDPDGRGLRHGAHVRGRRIQAI